MDKKVLWNSFVSLFSFSDKVKSFSSTKDATPDHFKSDLYLFFQLFIYLFTYLFILYL